MPDTTGPRPASPLSPELLGQMDVYWRAANDVSVGQVYLCDNPLLREPLTLAHIKPQVGHVYLEGTWSEIYPNVTQDLAGLKTLFRQFSFPGGISSHVAPRTPGGREGLNACALQVLCRRVGVHALA